MSHEDDCLVCVAGLNNLHPYYPPSARVDGSTVRSVAPESDTAGNLNSFESARTSGAPVDLGWYSVFADEQRALRKTSLAAARCLQSVIDSTHKQRRWELYDLRDWLVAGVDLPIGEVLRERQQ